MDKVSWIILIVLVCSISLLLYLLRKRKLETKLIVFGFLMMCPISFLVGGVIGDMFPGDPPYFGGLILMLQSMAIIFVAGLIMLITGIVLKVKRK